PRGCSPVPEQPRLDVLRPQRLAQQGILLQEDLPNREVVRRAPVPMHAVELLIGERPLRARSGRDGVVGFNDAGNGWIEAKHVISGESGACHFSSIDARRSMDDGRWTMDDGPWTMDHGPWTSI